MSIILNDEFKVRKGRILKVQNTDKPVLTNAKDFYYAIWLEDHKGKHEWCALLTEKQLQLGEHRAKRNPEDKLDWGFADDEIRLECGFAVKGRLIKVYNKGKFGNQNAWYYAVRVEDADGSNDRYLLSTQYEIDACRHRSANNIEDVPKKPFLIDLID